MLSRVRPLHRLHCSSIGGLEYSPFKNIFSTTTGIPNRIPVDQNVSVTKVHWPPGKTPGEVVAPGCTGSTERLLCLKYEEQAKETSVGGKGLYFYSGRILLYCPFIVPLEYHFLKVETREQSLAYFLG